jgi:urease accessory protein
MITINSILGNVKDAQFADQYEQLSRINSCEVIRIQRSESQRVRMRKTSDKGTDIAFTLPQGIQIRHKDVVLSSPNKMIIIEIEPESVATISINEEVGNLNSIEIPVRLGHTIGNLHRPLRIEGRNIYFPIQADTELEMFRKLLDPIIDHIKINKAHMVFEPEEGSHIHEH